MPFHKYATDLNVEIVLFLALSPLKTSAWSKTNAKICLIQFILDEQNGKTMPLNV